MGKITIIDKTIKDPIAFIGQMAGTCYNSDTTDASKNYKRGLSLLKKNHGRPIEFPKAYLIIDGYSAKAIRELYTHIVDVTRLQESTRYVSYHNFDFVMPHSIFNDDCADLYANCMEDIKEAYDKLLNLGIPQEDASMILPFGMKTKMVMCVGLRELIDIMQTRLCSRAFWEIRELCGDIKESLASYSYEWNELVGMYMKPKCQIKGMSCPEGKPCGNV